jgi:small subunit ribosomal protein S18
MSEETKTTESTESRPPSGGDRGERGGDKERSARPEGRDRGDDRDKDASGDRSEGGRGGGGGDRGGGGGDRGGGRGGDRGGDRGRRGGGGAGGGRRFFRRKKVDFFSVNKIDTIDYKDEKTLRQFVGDRGKILPRRHTGLSAMHQRELKTAIKRARNIALLPFAGD